MNLTSLYIDANYDRSPDDYHPDDLGHAAIAEVIHAAMEQQGLLPRPVL